MFILDETLKLVRQQTVLCVGDLMLDDFVYGEVSRISPEAPVQVLAVSKSELVVGGAGNVARNIAALGARCVFVGVIGDDEAGRTLKSALAAEPPIEPHLVVDRSRPTTRKVRFVSEHHSTHLLRADWEQAKPVAAEIEQAVIDAALEALPRVAAVVLSDYAKGVLTRRVVRALIDAANAAGKPVIVDPKGKDFTHLRRRDADHAEPPGACRSDPPPGRERRPRSPPPSPSSIASCQSEAVLVTRGEQGMTLVQNGAGRTARSWSRSRPIRSRCATSPAPAIPWSRCSPRCWRPACRSPTPCTSPTPAPRSWSASAAPRPCRPPSCARACSPRARSRTRTRSCSTGRCSTSGSPNGTARGCASASPTAASICCIPATSSF